jgi:hypothetical protein
MCTAIVSVEPGGTLLLAGIRDELTDRAWLRPGRHWPEYPGLVGGKDLLAGGTWLAVAPAERRVACVLNGRGRMAPPGSRRTRGVLPLQAAAEGRLVPTGLADFDPFHLLVASPDLVMLGSWDGERFTEQKLGPGLHMIVNSGLDCDLLAEGGPARPGSQAARRVDGRDHLAGDGPAGPEPRVAPRTDGRDHELARIAYFAPRLRAAPHPDPRPGAPAADAWGAWLPLMNGDGIDPSEPRALIVRRDLGDGRIWGTTSISLVALAPEGLRYDFTGLPGDPDAWYPVSVGH